jgi:hypothetical protein
MLIRYVLGAALVLGGCRCLAQSGFPDHCSDGSPLPFASIEVKQTIDSTCGLSGAPTATANSKLQNAVKDNFCAGMGGKTPETSTPQMLVDLQAQTKIASGFRKEPSDRQPLTALGEGKLVRMKAFLVEAHHANLGTGETVNCNGGAESQNDIHMAMGATANTQECDSVTTEISPHYRPASWNEIGHFERYHPATKKYTPDPGMAARLQAHAYRITGQLFFDASHTVCPCGTSCSPARSSLWEIHPLYAIEVCKSASACDENSDSDWMAFDTWWNSMVPLKKLRGPHAHPNREPH